MTDMVADAYANMATFRSFLRVTATTDATDPDSTLELLALEAAARAIDHACNRTFNVQEATATARVFEASNPDGYFDWSYTRGLYRAGARIAIDDLADPTTITSVDFDFVGDGDYTVASTAYRAGPVNRKPGFPYEYLVLDLGTAYPYGREGVQVTAKWGWTAVPSAIRNANLIQAARFLKRRDAPFGVAGSVELGSEMRLLARVDPDVAVMVGPFRKVWGAV